MEEKIIFMGIMVLLAIIDYQDHKIPNVIVIPAMLLGIYLTHNWIWAIVLFGLGVLMTYFNPALGAWDFNRQNDSLEMKKGEHIIYGGDVKLMAMIGAFLGWKALLVVVLTAALIKYYRLASYKFYTDLAVAPFALIACMFFLW